MWLGNVCFALAGQSPYWEKVRARKWPYREMSVPQILATRANRLNAEGARTEVPNVQGCGWG